MTDDIFLQKELHGSHRTGSCDIYSEVCMAGVEVREQGTGKDVWTWPGLLPLPTVVCKES